MTLPRPKISQGLFGGNSIQVHSGRVAAVFHWDNLDQGIVQALESFGRQLWFGYMHRDVFLYQHYLHAKQNLMHSLCNISEASDQQKRTLAFSLYMMRAGMNQKWRWPALLNRNPMGTVDQSTGNTRAFASIMLHEDPWLTYPVLFAEHGDFDVHALLKDPVRIQSDQQLNEMLGMPYDDSMWEPEVFLYIRMTATKDMIYPQLDYIGDGSYHDHNPVAGHQILADYEGWRSRYQGAVPLAIYTQWPELIRNSQRAWHPEIVGTSEGMLIDHRMAYAERTVSRYHCEPLHDQQHVLWVTQPRAIDLVDLLAWMDTTHSTYIADDWSFILYRQQSQYLNTFIRISRPENQ
jgi:hypothetical protein